MFFIPSSEDHQEVVNIYTWYGVIDEKITKQFTEETGIKVNIDFYDNNETLEARLLASNSGYDVVFPSASPYVALQKRAGVYLKLDHGTIPNIKYVSRDVKLQLKDIDKDLDYCVPYYWGTTGFMIDTKKLSTMPIFNGEASIKDIISYKSLKEAASFGVSFLEESIDVLPTVRLYLGIDPNSQSEKDLKPVMNFLQKIRPAIRRFATSRTVHDIVSKEIALAMTWSSYAHQAMDESEYVSKNYKYVLPKEGTLVWIDCMAIPKGAPNMRNAYKFIPRRKTTGLAPWM